MNYSPENIFLITGGAGFIGSNLARKILQLGSKVIIIDDFSSGKIDNVPINDNLELYDITIQDLDLNTLPKLSGVFHLAAQASVPISIENFYNSSSNNLLSSLKIIDYCSKSNIPLIYASSSAVYGNIEKGSEVGQIDLLHPYSVDKYILELYSKMAYRLYGLKSCGLRFFNVYGPLQDGNNPYSGVISIFIEKLLKKQIININGGYQTRDFVYIDDVIDAILLAYEYILKNDGPEVFNILCNKAISIDELAKLIGRVMGVNPSINYNSLLQSDPAVSIGSAKYEKKKLAFKPKVNIIKGLELTIDWMKSAIEKK